MLSKSQPIDIPKKTEPRLRDTMSHSVSPILHRAFSPKYGLFAMSLEKQKPDLLSTQMQPSGELTVADKPAVPDVPPLLKEQSDSMATRSTESSVLTDVMPANKLEKINRYDSFSFSDDEVVIFSYHGSFDSMIWQAPAYAAGARLENNDAVVSRPQAGQ